MEQPDATRAAFETWAEEHYLLLMRNSTDGYYWSETQIAWNHWQAAWKACHASSGTRQSDSFAAFADGKLWEPTYATESDARKAAEQIGRDMGTEAKIVRVVTFVREVNDV